MCVSVKLGLIISEVVVGVFKKEDMKTISTQKGESNRVMEKTTYWEAL
jgi:hypothetical protein